MGKNNKNVEKDSTKKVNLIEISENITDSSFDKESNKKHKNRLKRQRKIARRRANKANIEKSSLEYSKKKRYNILAQYHQLNYSTICDIVAEHKIKCDAINNVRLWVLNVSFEDMNNIRKWLSEANFKTKQGKEYRIRVAAYKHIDKVPKKESHNNKKPTNNTKEIKIRNKASKKKANIAKFKSKTKHIRIKEHKSHSCGPHLSTLERKLAKEIKKAVKFLSKKNLKDAA